MRTLTGIAALLAGIVILVSPAPALSATAARPGHAGRWITDSHGRVVVVHGLNVMNKRAPYTPSAFGFGANDATFLSRLGFNVVRLGVFWKAIEPRPGVYDDRYLTKIAATARTLEAHGVLSLIDFHQDMYNERFQGEGAPDWAVQDGGLANPRHGFSSNYYTNPALAHAEDAFWANATGPGGVGLQDRYAATWRHVALRFRSLPGVLGFELMNEPAPGGGFLGCVAAKCQVFESGLTGFDRRVARAIRTVDRRTLLFYEPAIGFDFGNPTQVGALDDGPAGFAFHVYCLSESASGGSSAGCDTEPRNFTYARAHVDTTREAQLLTEFGTDQPAELAREVQLADASTVGWTEWGYCRCADPTGPTRDPLVLDPVRPPQGSNVGRLALHTLVEPFPHLVAGTPLNWGFDPHTRAFTLRYSTRRADGRGRFGTGAISQVTAPHEAYPAGYRVRVSGGRVISRAGATTLEIAALPGATAVAVSMR